MAAQKFLFESWKIFQKWAQRTSQTVFNKRKEISFAQAAMYCPIYYDNDYDDYDDGDDDNDDER